MFDNLRARLAFSLLPKKVAGQNLYNVFSRRNAGVPIYTDLSITRATRQGYQMSVYVYRCVRAIVQAVSGIPWIVIDNRTGEPIPNHDFTKTWANPNPEFSGQDNMEFLAAHVKLVGNALIQPLMVSSRPKEFWICMPDLIQPIPSKIPGVWLDGYQVTETGGKVHPVPPETFIHFMQFNPGDPYWGIGDLQAAARTVDCDNEAMDTQKVSMQNRGTPDGVFVNESITNKDQFDEALRQVKEQYLPKDNRRAPWVIGGNTKWYQMSLTPVEMDYIKSRLSNKRDIAAAFGLDPWWVGDREHSTYNNVGEARKALYEDVGIPLLDDIKSTLNLKVAPLYQEDITITYDLSNVKALRDDYGQKVDQGNKLWSMGVPFSQINKKLGLGFEEYPGWNVGYLPFSVAPVGYSGSAPDSTQKTIHRKTLATEEQKVAHWKRIDGRRVAWSNTVSKKVTPLYDAELTAILKAVDGKTSSEWESQANSVIDNARPDWEKTLTAAYAAVIEDFGLDIAKDYGGTTKALVKPGEHKWIFDPFSDAVKTWIIQHAGNAVESILITNKDALRTVILKGIQDNATTPQLAKSIKQFYAESQGWKAMRVARTTVASASGYGQRQAAEQSGIVKTHTWVSSRDGRVRETHSEIDGETVPLSLPYKNGLMYPGDISGDPAEFINCRCVEAFGTQE